MTAEDIAHFEQALAAWDGEHESETYEGASHGWTVPDSPVFNPTQAERALVAAAKLPLSEEGAMELEILGRWLGERWN